MCGIIGYITSGKIKGNAIETVLDGLLKLEYRGYDSAGISYIANNGIKAIKSVGHVEKLIQKVHGGTASPDINICIGHTRWATHGAVTETNAHPHVGAAKKIAVVHNGIIENYLEIIKFLKSQNISMSSQTDTEVIPNLIEYYYIQNKYDLLDAVKQAITHLKGSFAFVVLSAADLETLIIAKHNMPLCVGHGENFSYITSDIPTALSKTDNIFVLDNDEIGIIKANKAEFLKSNQPTVKTPIKKTSSKEIITKGEFSTYMEKEINDIPAVFERLVSHYAQNPIPKDITTLLHKAKTIHICACGTAYHAGLVLASLLEKHAKLRTKTHIASEFRYNDPLLEKNDVAIIISQSGETADTIAAMHLLKQNKIPTIAFCNSDNSTIAREADFNLPTLAGFEIAVASTKAFCAQVLLSAILVNSLCKKPPFTEADFKLLPIHAREILGKNEEIRQLAKDHKDTARFFFIGKGIDATASLEAALKVKEITYTHSEGYPAGELKHGTLSLVDSNTLTIAFNCNQSSDKTANAIAEVNARGSKIWEIDVPASPLSFTYALIPAQLFALYLAQQKDLNPDKPRNLAKSVTVE